MPENFESLYYFQKCIDHIPEIEDGILKKQITPRKKQDKYYQKNCNSEKVKEIFGIQKVIEFMAYRNTKINYE